MDLFLSTYNLYFRLWNQSTFLLICTNGSTLYLDLNRKVGSIHLSNRVSEQIGLVGLLLFSVKTK